MGWSGSTVVATQGRRKKGPAPKKQRARELPPGPGCCRSARLEHVPHESRADDYVVDFLVLRVRHKAVSTAGGGGIGRTNRPAAQGATREEVTYSPVEGEAVGELPLQAGVQLCAEVLAVTLGPAGIERLAADERRLDTAGGDVDTVGVNRAVRPPWRHARPDVEGRGPGVIGLE